MVFALTCQLSALHQTTATAFNGIALTDHVRVACVITWSMTMLIGNACVNCPQAHSDQGE